MAIGTLAQGITQILSDAGLSAVYDTLAPENVDAPFVVFQTVASNQIRGISTVSDLRASIVQFSVYGSTAAERDLYLKNLRLAIDNYQGSVSIAGVSPQTTVDVRGVALQTEVHDIISEAQPRLYRGILDFRVFYREETA